MTASIRDDVRNEVGQKVFPVEELDWFCKNAYNIGLENISSWAPRHVVRLFRCCLAIISQYPGDIGEQDASDLTLRAMFCNYMIASALLSLGRSEDNIEVQLQDYLEMRKNVKDFALRFEGRIDALDDLSKVDITAKFTTLLVFDFEGAVRLKAWNDLGEIVRRVGIHKDQLALKAMADCILRAQPAPYHGMDLQVLLNRQLF